MLPLVVLALLLPSQAAAEVGPGSIVAGEHHSCAIKTDQTVTCWGDNSLGQAAPPPGKFLELAAGNDFTCGIKASDESLACWGSNANGAATPPSGTFKQISARTNHACGVRESNVVACWGANSAGQGNAPLGGNYGQVSAGDLHTCAIKRPNIRTLDCWGYPNDGRTAAPTGKFIDLASGYAHTCGIREDGTVACWGLNGDGQTDAPSGTFIHITAGLYFTCGIRTDGTVACWGLNTHGESTPPTGTFTDLGAGSSHACGIRTDGTLACWGEDTLGSLAAPAGTFGTDGTAPPELSQVAFGPPTLVTGESGDWVFDDATGGDVDHYRCKVWRNQVEIALTDPCTSPISFNNVTPGTYKILLKAVDAAGNSTGWATGFRSLVVRDAPPADSDFRFNGPADGQVLAGPMAGWGGKMDTRSTGFPDYDDLYEPAYEVDIQKVDREGRYSDQYSFTEKYHTCSGCEDVDFDDETLVIPFVPFDINVYEVFRDGALPTADGQYHLTAGQDGVVAQDMHTVRRFTIDSTAPDTSAVTEPSPTYTQHPKFDFTGTDPDPVDGFGSGIDKFECSLNGGAWQTCSSGNPIPQTAPEGQNTIDVRAVDKAGNADASPSSITFIVDLTAPNITIDEPDNKDRFLLHQGPGPVFSCTDPEVGAPPAASGFPPAGALTTSSAPGCVANAINDEDLGPHYFEVTATDRAGNTSTKKVAYVIDPPNYGNFVGEDHPLAYYRFNEQLGSSDMLDSSGNGHDGIYQNGIALQRDGATACERRPHPPRPCETANPAENKAAYFPARDGHGYVNNIPAPTTGYTMEAWVKPRDGADMMVMSHGGGGQLFIAGGRLAFRQVQDTIYSSGPDSAVPPGVWSHVAATWDGHNTRLYVNGHEVGFSSSANKPPSGTATFYIGYGEMAPWFHGTMDEAAYYDYALSQHRIADRHKIGVVEDYPSLEAGNSPFNTEGPETDPIAPKNKGVYAPTKVPKASFSCTDPDDAPGDSDVASCTATNDGVPINDGDALANGTNPNDCSDPANTHTFTVTATDEGYDPANPGHNRYVHTHTYKVLSFACLHREDGPLAYYRLGDGDQTMRDSSGNGHDGEYKNDTDSGPTGISADGDHARDFFGAGGYGYANGITAPQFSSTMAAWVKPLGNPDSTSTEFSDSALPPGWDSHIWNPGGAATVAGGSLTLDGARAGTGASYPSGRTLDFRGLFEASAPFSHGGFGDDYNNPPWAMFSVKGDGELYARTNNGAGDSLETHLPSSLLGSPHRFKVDWAPDKVLYYVDGDLVASHAISFGATQMRPLFSDFNTGAGKLFVDYARMSPYGQRDQSIVGHGDAGEIYIKDGFFKYRRMDTTVTSSVAVKPGQWQQVVGTWDGVDIRIYVDGQLAGITESTKRPSSSSTFYVGYGELAPWFNGAIDEVAYYPIAESPARVFQFWLADPPPSESGDAGNAADPGESANAPGSPTDPTDPTDPPTDPTTPVDPTDPPTDPVDPVDPPTDPVDPTDPSDPPVDPGDPTGPSDPPDTDDPTATPSAACVEANGDLATAERKLKAAKQKAAKAKGKKAKKKAKAKVRLAKLAVEQAESAAAERC